MTNASIPAHPSERAASSDQWLELLDQVLLGLDHALNNRLGALRAFAELLRDDVWRTTSAATDSVQKEVARLEETTSVIRLLARPRQPSKTGLILEDVMADVVHMQSMLYDVRDTPIELAPGPSIEPVWSERFALTRLLSVALYSFRRQTRAAGGEFVRVATESDESSVRIRFTSSVPATVLAIGEYADATASSLGAGWRTEDGSLELRLPTLKSHRGSAR